MRCLSCKYDLTHLTEHRCPECGRPFDPSDPSTFQVPPASNKKPLLRGIVLIAVSYPVSFALCYKFLSAYSQKVGVQWTRSRMLDDAILGGVYVLPLVIVAIFAAYSLIAFFWAESRKGQRPEG